MIFFSTIRRPCEDFFSFIFMSIESFFSISPRFVSLYSGTVGNPWQPVIVPQRRHRAPPGTTRTCRVAERRFNRNEESHVTQTHPPVPPNAGLRRQLGAAFDKPPDSAGILQGVRPMRSGLAHVRIVHVPSRKNGNRMIACEGSLEEKAALCLELDPTVDAYRSQPIAMKGPEGGRMVPDFAIRRGHGYAVIDIKPEGQLQRQSVVTRIRWARRQLAEAGIPHYLFTERALERQPDLQIRLQLKVGLTVELTAYQRAELLGCLQETPLSVRRLRAEAIARGISPFAVERLALLEDLRFSRHTHWTESTLLGGHTHEDSTGHVAGWSTVRDVCLPL
jgi:hypothetical protein